MLEIRLFVAVPSGPKSHALTVLFSRVCTPAKMASAHRHKPWEGLLVINDYWHSIWGLKSQSWRFYLLFLIATTWQEMIYGSPNVLCTQRTPLVPHEEARLDGSYLSKMSQVDFLIMNNMLEVKTLSVASKASWVREFEILFHLTDFAFNWWTTNISRIYYHR